MSMAIITDPTLYTKHNTNKLNVSFYTEPTNQTAENKFKKKLLT